VLIGGNSKAAMRRAATLGDGWLPWLVRRSELAEKVESIRALPGFGNHTRPFEVIMPLAPLNVEDYSHKELGKTKAPRTRDAIIEEVNLLAEAGATGTLVAPPRTAGVEPFLEWMDWFASEVQPAFKTRAS
jgi:hypothetical protein